MRLGCLLLIAGTCLLAIGDTAAISESTLAYPGHELIENRKRALRSTQYEKGGEDSSDDLKFSKDAADSDDEEERGFIISTINRPKYWRWFHAGMTPYTVKEVLGLTGVRRLWKPIKRREYEGYVVFYDEHCRMPKYKSFCRAHAGV